MADRPRWTITALTIPGREQHLRRLLASLEGAAVPGGAELLVVHNADVRHGHHEIEERIRGWTSWPITVAFSGQDPSIGSGRTLQLNGCKTPLICFVDDDVTVEGDVLPALGEVLRVHPLGLAGVRSVVGDGDTPFKPRANGSPLIEQHGIRYTQVQGMLVAGYANLIRDLGGFNPRRRLWGEWTELNLRMWRNGFPTGYAMDAGFLRHWEDAPGSPTRSLEGRERHVLWGLMCTALEYDAVDINQATATFWHLVEERYLAYSFGEGLNIKNLLKTTLELMPQLSSEWGQIRAFRESVLAHPFAFMPFHPLTEKDVSRVLAHADKAIKPYRRDTQNAGRAGATASVRGRVGGARRALTTLSRAMRRWAAGRSTPAGAPSDTPA